MTPYMLWSNYPLDIEEKAYTSTNYLGSYLLEAIGMDMPVYNRKREFNNKEFNILELEKEVPAVNYFGYLDKENRRHLIGEDNPCQKLLDDYQIFEYNNLFDKGKRLAELYE